MRYIHYGCGLDAPDGWVNFDASPSLALQKIPVLGPLIKSVSKVQWPANVRYGDITRKLPGVPHGSAKGVYCSHVLEHLSLEDFRKALQNTYLSLAEGGIFRMVIPDLEYHIRIYQSSNDDEKAIHFMKDTILGVEKRKKGIRSVMEHMLGNSKHLWMWDFNSLKVELERVGFKEIRKCEPGDSSDPNFKLVENPARFRASVAIECHK
tara:strand:+ start:1405 stop:2028 length:624 start_codon:yes stop_codon:yes gene_type:complete